MVLVQTYIHNLNFKLLPDVAKFLITSANERLEKTYAESKKMFMDHVKDENSMLKQLMEDHMDSWCMEMKEKVRNFK